MNVAKRQINRYYNLAIRPNVIKFESREPTKPDLTQTLHRKGSSRRCEMRQTVPILWTHREVELGDTHLHPYICSNVSVRNSAGEVRSVLGCAQVFHPISLAFVAG